METANIGIRRIIVKDLFGYFDYDIDNRNKELNDSLMLLYGDNGSGKTTILRLVFYLLSSKDKSGHKTKIANVKFKSFSVHLSNDISISAERKEAVNGSFRYIVKDLKEKRNVFSVGLSASYEGDQYSIQLDNDSKDGKTYMSILEFISDLNIKLFYLSDTRKSLNAGVQNYNEDYETNLDLSRQLEIKILKNKIIRHREDQDLINLTIRSLENYYKSEAISASNVGEKETTNIYLKIVEQVTNTVDDEKYSIASKIEDLKSILEEVNNRTESYSKFGLVSSTEYSQIKQALSIASNKQEVIYNILEPFIRGLKAKLDALQQIQRQLSSFTGCLNSFLSYKEISYNIKDGFAVKQKLTGEDINFKDLSSGEKQLILLFSNAILASSQATIFIIDEPEISLNIKWQRKLLNYLLQLSPNSNTQFLIATHSIELLTNQKESVMRLVNTKEAL